MPGPRATSRTKGRQPAPNSPNKKTAARLARRIDAYHEPTSSEVGSGLMSHKPGSQNRKK